MGALQPIVETGQEVAREQAQQHTADVAGASLANFQTPAELATAIRSNPSAREMLIRRAHTQFGNGFVAEALPLLALPENQARNAAPDALDTNALRNENENSQGREKNEYTSASLLPYTAQGWDATTILTKVGQRDNLAATDSDGTRCVQAVGIASHVLRGPGATIQYLQTMLADAAHGATAPTPRQMSGRAVLARVCDRLRSKQATFDDLYWAQEALHDITDRDNVGTPDNKVAREIAPTATTDSVALSQWCDGPQQVVAAANGLAEGQQLVLTTWEVIFNDKIFEWNATHRRQIHDVNVDGRSVHEQRLTPGQKPPASQIVNGRDNLHGHQLLVMRVGGELRLYEPETSPGGHYLPLSIEGLQHYFADKPDDSTYGYMRLDQKITPK